MVDSIGNRGANIGVDAAAAVAVVVAAAVDDVKVADAEVREPEVLVNGKSAGVPALH